MGVRREGRELALKLLYREEVTGLVDDEIPGIDEVRPEARTFADQLTSGVRAERDSIDRAISEASEHWEISRMGAVDRSILRIGVFELLFMPDIPVGAIINEAVDEARKFSSGECGRFVNGVLDHIARTSRGRAAEDLADAPGPAGSPDGGSASGARPDDRGESCATGS
jgi:N utilization substance protein B